MKAGLIYVRTVLIWRFWAFGYHTMPSKAGNGKAGKFKILTIAFGPLRFQFLDYGSYNWPKIRQQEQRQRLLEKGAK